MNGAFLLTLRLHSRKFLIVVSRSGDKHRNLDAATSIWQSSSEGAVVSFLTHTPYQVTIMSCAGRSNLNVCSLA